MTKLCSKSSASCSLQTISFFSHLYENEVNGPFLVVGPLSTVANWAKEFERWTPGIPVVLYHGKKPDRDAMRRNKLLSPIDEWRVPIGNPYKAPPPPSSTSSSSDIFRVSPDSYPVVITSYEIVMSDKKFLQHMPWKYIVVDEGHRLKNLECKLIKELKQYESANRLLLTGTPLQNNLSEVLGDSLFIFSNGS
jgi:ATP-dependent DNA helicase